MSTPSSCNGAGAQIGPEAEYQTVPEQNNHAREPSVNTQVEYDVVPDKSNRPPPLPGPRQVTTNPVYETKGNTFSHPATLKHRQDPPYSKDAADLEQDYKGGDTWKRCIMVCLFILVVVGLLMAVASMVLVLVMWFGAYVPGCPNVAESTSEDNCTCRSIDIHNELQKLQNDTQALSDELRRLNSSLVNISSSNFADLSKRAESLSASLMNINSSCLNMLDEVRNTPVSLENTTFRANLTNANIFGSCLYEYLSNCTMNITTESCETDAHPVTVDGYYNLEQTCHVAIQLSGSGSRFAPANNLIIDSDMMRCSCAAVRIVPNLDRTATFTCFLFRARCPISSDFGVPVIKQI